MLHPVVVQKLKSIVGEENVLSRPVDLAVYEYDASLCRGKPAAVVQEFLEGELCLLANTCTLEAESGH